MKLVERKGESRPGRAGSRDATGSRLGGSYTWHPDGTLASYPGPGYVRNLDYDEEGRLRTISRDQTLVYEYAYGFDGGRRWRKDYGANQWTWYPCGVACGSGELVEMTSDLSGSSWAVHATSTKGATQVRVGSEFPLSALAPGIAKVLDPSGTVTTTRLSDYFDVTRYSSSPLSQDLTRYQYGAEDDEETVPTMAATAMQWKPPSLGDVIGITLGKCNACILTCMLRKLPRPDLADCRRECQKKGDCGKPKTGPGGGGGTPPPSGGGGGGGTPPPGQCPVYCDNSGTPTMWGYPGTTVTCPNGAKVELPKDCAKPTSVPPVGAK